MEAPLLLFRCPKCGYEREAPPPVLVAYRCPSGRCTYEPLRYISGKDEK